MLPPKDVYSVVIHNHTDKVVTVHVAYTNVLDETSSQQTFVVAAGEQASAEQLTFTHGSAEYTMTITSVQVEGAPAKLTAPFPHVNSPTKDYPINIVSANGSIELQGKTC
ncbi:hypothetical protein ABL78_5866 [Leptomonas seymouri]|uniref:Uncharacterized protein n=1 Tax=Leptomonas seymouri TaxID=5684 RepID=A0A0N1IJF7_LEPSE|nr:hypothetical protein ABL78_5866 [Leptomonas seymouri]|eukprot:KPI85100.1 hypothetical protein ABL78_5866 [Leptomonas seymouri]